MYYAEVDKNENCKTNYSINFLSKCVMIVFFILGFYGYKLCLILLFFFSSGTTNSIQSVTTTKVKWKTADVYTVISSWVWALAKIWIGDANAVVCN